MSKESEVNVEIETEVNEVFIKSKIYQELINTQDNPVKVKIEIYKYPDIIFSSFLAKIGNSIVVKSKLLKKEIAKEEKYEDSIASGNADIFVSEDSENNSIIINIGNIPPKEKVIFISEFIQNTKYSKKIDMELFRNLPFFKGNTRLIKNKHLKGKILIKTQADITNVKKDIEDRNIKIIEEKYLNNSKNNYLIIYEINAEHIGTFIKSSKIFVEIELDKPLIYSQKLSKDSNEKIYVLQYKYKEDPELKKIKFKPALFIFLLY